LGSNCGMRFFAEDTLQQHRKNAKAVGCQYWYVLLATDLPCRCFHLLISLAVERVLLPETSKGICETTVQNRPSASKAEIIQWTFSQVIALPKTIIATQSIRVLNSCFLSVMSREFGLCSKASHSIAPVLEFAKDSRVFPDM